MQGRGVLGRGMPWQGSQTWGAWHKNLPQNGPGQSCIIRVGLYHCQKHSAPKISAPRCFAEALCLLHCCGDAPVRLGHLCSLPGDLSSEDGDFLLCHKLLFRNSSLPHFPCCFLSFPCYITASTAVNVLSGGRILERGCTVPRTPETRRHGNNNNY